MPGASIAAPAARAGGWPGRTTGTTIQPARPRPQCRWQPTPTSVVQMPGCVAADVRGDACYDSTCGARGCCSGVLKNGPPARPFNFAQGRLPALRTRRRRYDASAERLQALVRSTVDQDRLPGDVGRALRRQPHDGAGHLLWLPHSLEGGIGGQAAEELLLPDARRLGAACGQLLQ